MRDSRNLREKPKECGTFEALSRGTSKKVEEMHRTGSCYKYSITAENSTTRDSTYIEEGFRLQIRFVETELGGGRESVPQTEQVRKNVKVQEGTGF